VTNGMYQAEREERGPSSIFNLTENVSLTFLSPRTTFLSPAQFSSLWFSFHGFSTSNRIQHTTINFIDSTFRVKSRSYFLSNSHNASITLKDSRRQRTEYTRTDSKNDRGTD